MEGLSPSPKHELIRRKNGSPDRRRDWLENKELRRSSRLMNSKNYVIPFKTTYLRTSTTLFLLLIKI